MLPLEQARERVKKLWELFDPCRLCPRECGARRSEGQVGVCGAGKQFRLAAWAAHRGEEPPISGERGSGTIFASHCPMKCCFCQNYPFSQLGNGQDMEIDDLAETFIKLAGKGVHNLNFVTPTHFTPHLFDALIRAYELSREQSQISVQTHAQMPAKMKTQMSVKASIDNDLRGRAQIQDQVASPVRKAFSVESLPVVYNTSGFESLEVLKLLDGMVDIYIPDIRYADNAVGKQLSKVPDYVERDREAILEMARQVGAAPIEYGPDGMARRGLIIRHLVLPGGLAGTASSLRWLRDTLGTQVAVSLMCQYFPAHLAPTLPGLDRAITVEEYSEAVDLLDGMGFENAWAQDPDETGGA